MLQNFQPETAHKTVVPHLKALRAVIKAAHFDGFLVPRTDPHMGEEITAHDQRLAWLTNFSGSAGYCAVLLKHAAVFSDGRYTIQMRQQIDHSLYTLVATSKSSLSDWLIKHLPNGGKIAYDPWLHTIQQIEHLAKQVKNNQIMLIASENLVDKVWHHKPPLPKGLLYVHALKYAGVSHWQKCSAIAQALKTQNCCCAVLTKPDSIAWLLNIRGSDLKRTPVAFCFAIIDAHGLVDLFIDPAKINDATYKHLGQNVTVKNYKNFATTLANLKAPVLLDKKITAIAIYSILHDANIKVQFANEPTILAKACKNPCEIAGAVQGHIRDGVAVCEFLAWFYQQDSLDEITVIRRLESFRGRDSMFKNISFDTICGSGAHGAIVHYRVNTKSNRALHAGDLVLIDSGAQYNDATTDLTRTVAFKKSNNAAARLAFTLVLKGMIAISNLRFPVGICGRDIDCLARSPLWSAGLDYNHGTGHGVGAYLSVHEGPQAISRRSHIPLCSGMIVSNEPGYYKEGAYGIRIENLLYIRHADVLEGADAREMLEFETLTLAPIDRSLIIDEKLNSDERRWLDAYHARVAATLAPLCSPRARAYLRNSCAPI